jgi:hypothetical protein
MGSPVMGSSKEDVCAAADDAIPSRIVAATETLYWPLILIIILLSPCYKHSLFKGYTTIDRERLEVINAMNKEFTRGRSAAQKKTRFEVAPLPKPTPSPPLPYLQIIRPSKNVIGHFSPP